MKLCHKRWGVFRVIAGLTFLSLITGCTSKESEQEAILLNLQLTPGMERTIIDKSQVLISMSVRGLVIEVDTSLNSTYEFAVNSVDSNGNATIEVTFINFKMSQTTTFGDNIFSLKDIMGGRDPFQRMASIVRDKSFTMEINSNGLSGEIKGLNLIRNLVEEELDLTSSLSGLDIGTAMQDSLQKAVLGSLEDESIRLIFANLFEVNNDQPVHVGDSWPGRVQEYPDLNISITPTYTLVDWDGALATLERNSEMTIEEDGSYLHGTELSTFTIDGQTGLVKHIEANAILNGTTQTATDTSANHFELVNSQFKSTQNVEVLGS